MDSRSLLPRDQVTVADLAGFVPRKWLAGLATALFGVATLWQWTLLIRRGQKYMLTLTLAMTCMTIGLALRLAYATSPTSVGLYIATTLLVLLAPCGFLAIEYIILQKIVSSLDPVVAAECLPVPVNRLAKIFLWSDFTTLNLQGFGGGFSSNDNPALVDMGRWVITAALAIQLVSFVFFVFTALTFGFRLRSRHPHRWSEATRNGGQPVRKRWTTLYLTSLASSVGVLVRCVFRLAEYALGPKGYLARHEWYFYGMDSFPLVFAMGLFCFVWPPAFLPIDEGTMVELESLDPESGRRPLCEERAQAKERGEV
ncbi:hypothetical protein RQP46_004655 [Phenoliferia psychrophenolica]